MKKSFIVLCVVLFVGLSCTTVSAEVERVPAINTAADQPVIIPKPILELSSVFQPAHVVVEVEDGTFFLVASNDDPTDRQVFIQDLIATLKEQLQVDSDATNYESFSVVKVIAAIADDVEPILQGFINGYVVGAFFLCGSAYSFAW